MVGKPPSPPFALQSPAFDTFFFVPHIRHVVMPHFIPPNPRFKDGLCSCDGSVQKVFPDRNASACQNGHRARVGSEWVEGIPAYALFGGMRELIVFLCCASHASSGDCALSFVLAAVVLVLSSSLVQRREPSARVSLVESWRNDTLPIAQRGATVAESALKHFLASADIDVDGVTGVPMFFPQVQPFRRRTHHEFRCTTGGIRGTAA